MKKQLIFFVGLIGFVIMASCGVIRKSHVLSQTVEVSITDSVEVNYTDSIQLSVPVRIPELRIDTTVLLHDNDTLILAHPSGDLETTIIVQNSLAHITTTQQAHTVLADTVLLVKVDTTIPVTLDTTLLFECENDFVTEKEVRKQINRTLFKGWMLLIGLGSLALFWTLIKKTT